MYIDYIGYHGEESGYGRSADAYCSALASMGYLVRRVTPHALRAHACTDRRIVHCVPGDRDIPPSLYDGSIVIATHEADRLPVPWISLLSRASEVWVPSLFNLVVFAAHLRVPVRRVVHPFEGFGLASPVATLKDFIGERKVFYCIGNLQNRKGLQTAVDAFREAFAGRNDLVFVVKTRRDDQELGAARPVASLSPDVVVVESGWTRSEISWLHSVGYCYVSLHRGEGWGYGVFDAVMHGNRVVCTDYGGPRDFLSSDLHHLVAYSLDRVNSPYEHYSCEMRWATPSTTGAVNALRIAIDQPPQGLHEYSQAAQEEFSMARVTERLSYLLHGVGPFSAVRNAGSAPTVCFDDV